ncbi:MULTISPECIES: 16S rRNA (cytidine(1402)-2'-O)-methyltransferase [Robiginitalea]|uniref:16S rRNA (cytidine(1402)-2'-O)-methyltransferase n=1 Tax=Robiginitalea TaxID=252306 RepID=UPI00234B153B|nr:MULTISPECIES: 16S rRNA (cytidine(1402)-2'-O)-methyltransferase [unclassified Robiginitalea]MDC6353080.1 16S rRNA (cytidine(1402)-2'-O)-methyltransferase [Robiginitalea sp. PM2]MDC6373753.1 16S rRNA (cytidine(1402)-2'-O)-methyltransferase [Robiginitalea sp. SP8]
MQPGKLFIVPTPIGNLGDITLRALEVLREADLILSEDTRTSGKLLKHYEVETPQRSYHMHNEHRVVDALVAEVAAGRTLALISDAGTPGISDPGFLLVRTCIQAGHAVDCLPGATAFVPALVCSGFPTDRFVFEGFLPHKKGRQTRLAELAGEARTMVFYESPHRLLKALEQFADHFGAEREVAVCRELTKHFEEIVRGTVSEVADHFKQNAPRGEFVLVVRGK